MEKKVSVKKKSATSARAVKEKSAAAAPAKAGRLTLANLSPAPRSRKYRTRVGRGESSGVGKTCGKGGKGQTARTGGKIRPGFEGGQMPLYRRLPKWGFTSRQKVFGTNQYNVVNLAVLESFEDNSTVDIEALKARGFAKHTSKRGGLKILAGGKLTRKLNVKANAFSETARKQIESLGGHAELIKSGTEAQGKA